jgi:flagellar hook-length control protein FliK
MSITETKDGINVSIMTEQNSTKDMLNKQSDELAKNLSDQGLKLGKIDIQLTANFDQMLANQNKDFQNMKDNKRGRATSRVSNTKNDEKDASTESTLLKTVRNNEGSLDLVA